MESQLLDSEDKLRFAYSVAERFLAHKRPRTHATRNIDSDEDVKLPRIEVAHTIAEKWLWDDKTALAEFPIFSGTAQKPSGSIITSTNDSLPPILRYSTSGPTLASQVRRYIGANPATKDHDLLEMYLASPLEPVVKVRKRSSNAVGFITLPELKTYMLPSNADIEASILRDTSDCIDRHRATASWSAIKGNNGYPVTGLNPPQGQGEIFPVGLVDTNIQAVTYCQACNVYPGGQQDGNYCSPQKIAGCAPVAWAMLASSLKSAGQDSIWPGVQCWSTPWPTKYGDVTPSMCPEVNQTIWAIHQAMGTSDDGSTPGQNLINGGNYLDVTFGLPWGGGWANVPTDEAVIVRMIGALNKPVMFVGTGQWDTIWTNMVRNLGLDPQAINAPGPGAEGHCVVLYGLNITFNQILVTLGWGTTFPDCWIDLSSFPGSTIIYNVFWVP